MADFEKIHRRHIEQAASIAARERRPYFRVMALTPFNFLPSAGAAKSESTWIVSYEMKFLSNGSSTCRPTKAGQQAIDAWTKKYRNEPDWRWEVGMMECQNAKN